MNCWNFRKYISFSYSKFICVLTHLLPFQISRSAKPPLQAKEKPIDKEMSKEEQLVFSLKVSQAAKTSVFWRMWISRVKGLLVNQTITSQHHCCFSLQWCSCGAFSTTTTRAMPCCTYLTTGSLLLLLLYRMS